MCCWAPPSDQDPKEYVTPPEVWLRASIVCVNPTSVSRTNGVVLRDAVEIQREPARHRVERQVHLLRIDRHDARGGQSVGIDHA